MIQTPLLQKSSLFLNRRWQIILAGLIVQGIVSMMVGVSLLQAGPPDITVAPVAGNPKVCRLVTVAPFTDTWMNGMEPGMLVWSTPIAIGPLSHMEDLSSLVDCRSTSRPVLVQVVGQNTILHLNTEPQIDLTNLVLTGLLAVVFSLTGMTIFLRASDRPLAHIAYALFYSASLIFCFLNVRTYLWVNVLLYILSISARGLATTFVCLLPHPTCKQSTRRSIQISPYTQLVVGIVLALVSLPVVILLPQARVIVSLIAFGYTVACMATLAWVMFWGIRRLSVNEKQMARVVVVGIVVLLFPMTLNPHLVRYNTFVLNSAAHLYSVSLMFLPIVCGYALIRHQLLGTTSLLSRQVMRVLMWLLLASFCVVPSLILLHSLEGTLINQEARDYIYAGLLILSLWLFPLAWSKVRDMGDQILYHDFYQYNRSLRDLSATLTRLQRLDEICTFVLPRLTTLLNATGVALLIRTPHTDTEQTGAQALPWHIYHHTNQQPFLPNDRLMSIANLALTHLKQPSHDPLLLDGVLLLPLYAEDRLSGFLCLGPKLNFEPYSRQDTSFLATLTAQLSVLEVNSRYLEQAQTDAQKLTALNHRVVSAQEDERRHLALELHDEVLQQAMLLVRQLSDASTMMEVAEVMPLARSLVTNLRHTCLELRPPLLDELGLDEALYWLARQTEQHDKLQVMVSCVGSGRIRPSAQVELALYRVVQEALTNVIKHARASRVTIRLSYGLQGAISLLVWDNGRGFKQGRLVTESLGLVGMRERMAAVGGQLQVRTHMGRGVIIRATYRPLVSSVQMPVLEEVIR